MADSIVSFRLSTAPVLAKCIAGTHRMMEPESNKSVGVLQQALLDAGYDLSVFGADEKFGSETGKAVVDFKKSRGLKPTDPVVGPGTTAALDTVYALFEGKTIPSNRTITDRDFVDVAQVERIDALRFARDAIKELKLQFEPGVPVAGDPVVKAFKKFMFVKRNAVEFWPTVNAALLMIEGNLDTVSPIKIDRSVGDFAHVDATVDPKKGVTIGEAFFNTNSRCQREVITHEYFHFIVGAQHHYDATTTAEAIQCPHHLTELVFKIARDQVEGCSLGSVCI